MKVRKSIYIKKDLYEKFREKHKISIRNLILQIIEKLQKEPSIFPPPPIIKIHRTSFDIDKNLWKEFKTKCIDKELKVNQVLKKIILNWINKNT